MSPGPISSVAGPPARPAANRPIRDPGPWLAIAGILLATIIALKAEGRLWWCTCGTPRPWISDVWTKHCSQHLTDPYSLTHLSHGLIFYWLLAWICPRLRLGWRLCIAVAVASGWEVLENSSFIIDRYRTATMSLDYLGDSVVNATGDILSCMLGFFIARRAGFRLTLAVFIVSELVLLALIRDNLTLNVLMLIYPVPAIKAWQSVGHGAGLTFLAAWPRSLRAVRPPSLRREP